MMLTDPNKWRKFTSTNILCPVASFGERAARRQISDIRRQAGDLIKFLALLVSRIWNAS